MRDKAFIQTRSGRPFWPLNPNPDDIFIEDIAFGLSREHRFGSHSDITVAQHSFFVSLYVPECDMVWGELHDATEGLGLRDIPRPLKYLPEFAFYREAERRLMDAVCIRFGLPFEEPKSVKIADCMVLAAEIRDHMQPQCEGWDDYGVPVPEKMPLWTKRRAEKEFLARFRKLTKSRQTVFA